MKHGNRDGKKLGDTTVKNYGNNVQINGKKYRKKRGTDLL